MNGLKGPGLGNELAIDLPACVQVKTEQDARELQEFISAVIRATRADCLTHVDKLAAVQVAALEELAKKLQQ